MPSFGATHLKPGEKVPTLPVKKQLIAVYNYFADIDGELVLKSYDQTFVAPMLGDYIMVPAHHAANLVDRNPELLTFDADKAKNAKLVATGEVVTPADMHQSILDRYSVEELQAALSQATERMEIAKTAKNKRVVGRKKDEKSDSVSDEDLTDEDEGLEDGDK